MVRAPILISLVFAVDVLEAALPAHTVSPSREFVIYGGDATLRGSVSELAEQTKSNLLALLGRRDIAAMLDRFRGEYEWVIVDSPPVASVTDALLLARHADIVLFVVQHNKVDKKLVKRALDALRRTAPGLLGIVFNAVELKSGQHQYYYYRSDETVVKAEGGRA